MYNNKNYLNKIFLFFTIINLVDVIETEFVSEGDQKNCLFLFNLTKKNRKKIKNVFKRRSNL
jgi:hypothetical protein